MYKYYPVDSRKRDFEITKICHNSSQRVAGILENKLSGIEGIDGLCIKLYPVSESVMRIIAQGNRYGIGFDYDSNKFVYDFVDSHFEQYKHALLHGEKLEKTAVQLPMLGEP